MAAITADKSILQAAFIDVCVEIGGDLEPSLTFAKALRRAALTGTSSAVADVLGHLQDYSASSISNEGSATQFIRSLDAAVVAELAHITCEHLTAAIAAGGLDQMPKPGSSTYGSFF